MILWGFLILPPLALGNVGDSSLAKNLEIVLVGNKQKSQGIVERGAEGAALLLVSPSRVENAKLVQDLWAQFDLWLQVNGEDLSLETLTTLEGILEDVIDANESDPRYTKTGWKPALFYGFLTTAAVKATGAFWFRRLLRKVNIKIRKTEQETKGKCCRSSLIHLTKTGFSKIYRSYPGLTEWGLLSGTFSLGYYVFLYKDEEPGDLEQDLAERQILPKIRKLKETALPQKDL